MTVQNGALKWTVAKRFTQFVDFHQRVSTIALLMLLYLVTLTSIYHMLSVCHVEQLCLKFTNDVQPLERLLPPKAM
jgi:hypothetical protein